MEPRPLGELLTRALRRQFDPYYGPQLEESEAFDIAIWRGDHWEALPGKEKEFQAWKKRHA